MTRMICWFSCGGPSAVAAKEAIRLYSGTHEVVVVNCDTRPSEHSDNYRFSEECERWFGQPIVYIRNNEYATIDEVFEKTRYLSGIKGARCTTELKKIPRLRFSTPDDIHVFGFVLAFANRRCTALGSTTTTVPGASRPAASGIGTKFELISRKCSSGGASNRASWA
jgi:hypothetical protein